MNAKEKQLETSLLENVQRAGNRGTPLAFHSASHIQSVNRICRLSVVWAETLVGAWCFDDARVMMSGC